MRTGPPLGLLIIAMLAGCADDPPATPEAFPLEVYRFHWPGSDVAVEGVPLGGLLRVTNPTTTPWDVRITMRGVDEALLGPIGTTGGSAPQQAYLPARMEGGFPVSSPSLRIAPGDTGLFLTQILAAGNATVDLDVSASYRERSLVDSITWNVTTAPAASLVTPGDHVQTATVGVYLNGTSFYTNVQAAHDDPDFLRTYDAADFDATPLPIYVYGADRDEQPAGSADSCHFTTIEGYNKLLQTQAEGSTNVRLLRPDQAYTREGNEEHLLYGEWLVFLNTIVAHEGATTATDTVPDPTAPCFNAQNTADYITGAAPFP